MDVVVVVVFIRDFDIKGGAGGGLESRGYGARQGKPQLARLLRSLPPSGSQHSRRHLPTDSACWPPVGGGHHDPPIFRYPPCVVAPLASAFCKAECFSSLSFSYLLRQSFDAWVVGKTFS